MKKGKFIILEGVDGVGKTTIINELVKQLDVNHTDLVFLKTREPGGTELAESIRNKIFDYGDNIDSKLQFQLFHTSRIFHFLDKIKPALDSGINVLCDRHYLSTMVYQGKNINRIIQMTRELLHDYEDNVYNIILNPINLEELNISDKADKNSYDSEEKMKQRQELYIEIFTQQERLNLVGDVYIVDVTRDLESNVDVLIPIIDAILED